MKILLVEDDNRLGLALGNGLREEAFFDVKVVKNGFEARDLVAEKNWDIFIFDVMLPGLTGIQLCEYVRFKNIKTPILMLSALGDPEDKIRLLDIGADDYLVKPFHFKELISRINALKRRADQYLQMTPEVLTCANLHFDFFKNKVYRDNKIIELSQKEFRLLHFLLKNKDKVVTRMSIFKNVWEVDQEIYTNVIDVYISYLRSKIDSGFNQKLIRTIKGRGYMISDM